MSLVPTPFATLADAATWYGDWLNGAALPLWAVQGVDPGNGGFREGLSWQGTPCDPWRRTRVQARQTFVFAEAAADGLAGPWRATARAGFAFFRREGRLANGLFGTKLDTGGRLIDPEPRLYEQAFVLLALAALQRCDVTDPEPAQDARAILEGLAGFRHAAGGFREAGPEPFQANAHMHLFEAALAWEAADGGGAWSALADEIARLALRRFIDPARGVLHEFFDGDWRALTGERGLIEPGHQFEWCWLLARWGSLRGEASAVEAARRLFATGRRGFNPSRLVVVNALGDDLTIRDAGARLWPQTEHLKAARILGEDACALQAASGLVPYLETPTRGVWRERMRPDGGFIEEPSPATSLYHLFLAIRELG
jgi:mannose/cellobiose epimerase-like protein (N-acyl-D-glucosamine 2-epimerase family)